MKFRTETTNGVTRYFVNEKMYERLEDMPEEFRKQFLDQNNNGIPDQIENIFSGSPKDFFGSVFGAMKETMANPPPDPMPAQTKRYDMGRESSTLPTLIRISFGIVIGIAIAWFAFQYSNTQKENSTEETTETSSSEESSTPIDTENATPSNPDKLILQMDDPNEPPYRAVIMGTQNGLTVFKMTMPDGELLDLNDSTISIQMNVEEGTNLSQQTFSVTITPGTCNLAELEEMGATIDNVRLSGNDYTYAVTSDAGAGQYYDRHYYSLNMDGYCIAFTLLLHSSNPSLTDPPMTPYDQEEKTANLEMMIKGIVWR
jgi:hypothetical protein